MFASTENRSEPLPLFLETALLGIPPHPAENISLESLLYNQTECTEKAIYSKPAEKLYRFVPSCCPSSFFTLIASFEIYLISFYHQRQKMGSPLLFMSWCLFCTCLRRVVAVWVGRSIKKAPVIFIRKTTGTSSKSVFNFGHKKDAT